VVAVEDHPSGCLATIEVATRNQKDEEGVAGTATALLPRRGA
jgi:acyl dehydratase